MNKKELVSVLAKKISLPNSKTDAIVSMIIETMMHALAKEEEISLVGFGSFSVKKREARKGRNPQTGETIKISARKAIKFSAGKELKKIINNNK